VSAGDPIDELGPAERQELLGLARASIEAALARRDPPTLRRHGALAEPRGAFVSLHRRGDHELRGCVGSMVPERPLVETVARMAVSAALHDGRFEPVTKSELPGLVIEISVLGRLRDAGPDEVEVGRHGVLIEFEGRRGVLLPQVATAHGWPRETFLDQVCGKAGLPADAWKVPGIRVRVFTASVFGEA
jgi:AmmeMemoRadiSam system protein A